MESELKKLKKDIEKLIEKFDKISAYGVVSYLEAMLDIAESTIEEYEEFLEEEEESNDD